MINIYVTYKGDKESLVRFYEDIKKEGLAEASRNEEGNIRYEYFWPVERENELFLLEAWKDKEAQKFHNEQDHFRRLGELKIQNGIETEILIEECDAR